METEPGKAIAAKRRMLGLSQRELAKKAGISNGTISRIESGERTDPDTIRKLSSVLGIDYLGLLEAYGILPDDPAASEIRLAMEKMSPGEKASMLRMLEKRFPLAFRTSGTDTDCHVTYRFRKS